MEPRFLGLDLAWSEKNPSGLAALDRDGRLIGLSSDRRGDDDILAWVRAHLGDCGAVAIDMPTIVRNPSGSRPCERALRTDFRRHDAAPYPANTGLAPFKGGGRAHRLLGELVKDRVVHDCRVLPSDPRTLAFEVFPHPAAVELFGLQRIIAYKKKQRRWDGVLAEWARYRALLGSLAEADPPLGIGAEFDLPAAVDRHGYKRRDDELDAILCAYIAAFVWRHGSASDRVRV
ncbi:MAG: pyrophosphokinae, partial [Candidatus Eremiobacteraeota bacterium]|nr:pyrophosphokinae [Candidatus Eremiobacteraeota bacterium]